MHERDAKGNSRETVMRTDIGRSNEDEDNGIRKWECCSRISIVFEIIREIYSSNEIMQIMSWCLQNEEK